MKEEHQKHNETIRDEQRRHRESIAALEQALDEAILREDANAFTFVSDEERKDGEIGRRQIECIQDFFKHGTCMSSEEIKQYIKHNWPMTDAQRKAGAKAIRIKDRIDRLEHIRRGGYEY